MYLAMKEVLELNHLYNCSPAAVGQQVYATAILYNTLRFAQGSIAATAGIPPEALSVDKLFPTLIDHYIKATCVGFGVHVHTTRSRAEHAGFDPRGFTMSVPWLRVRIRDPLLEKHVERRKRRRYCKGRTHATSYNEIPGAGKFLQS